MCRHLDPERLGCSQVDGQFEFVRRLDGQLCRAGATQNTVDVISRPSELIAKVDTVCDQPTICGEGPERINRWQPVLCCQVDDHPTMRAKNRIRQHDEPAVRLARKRLDGAHDLGSVAHAIGGRLYSKRRSYSVDRSNESRSCTWIAKDGYSGQRRQEFLEQLQPFSADRRFEVCKAGRIAARSRQTRDKAGALGIGDSDKHDRDGANLLLDRLQYRSADSDDDIRSHSGEVHRVRSHPLAVACATIIDAKIAALAPSQLLQPLFEGGGPGLRAGVALGQSGQNTDPPHPLALLRPRRERPRGRRAAEQRDELAPLHSIASSASASKRSGMVRPSVLAVFRLITNSNLVDCSTGRSAGFAPLRIFAV